MTGRASVGRSPELAQFADEEQDDLEGVREAHIVELGRRGEGNRRIAGVERSADATVR